MTLAPTPLHRRKAPRFHALASITTVVLIAVGAVLLLILLDVFQGSTSSSSAQGSGIAATQTRNLPTFNGVELAGANNVTVRVGGRQSVIVRGDQNLLGRVTTQVHAGNLVIGNTTGSFTTKSPMSVSVSVASLKTLKLSGSGVITVSAVRSPSLTVMLTGAGVLRAGGSATRLDVTLSGSGDAELNLLAARDVRAAVVGSGRILVTATKSLDASVPGKGAIIFGGNPAHVITSVTGSGTVTEFAARGKTAGLDASASDQECAVAAAG